MSLEGQLVAKFFNEHGITVFGLKYRTKPPSQDVAADALADGQRAMRIVRSRAAEWKIDPNRIGILGYSAGANLALNLASHFDAGKPVNISPVNSSSDGVDPLDRVSCLPDFAVMLSTWPNARTLDAFPLRPDSPPTFIAIAKDDRTAPPPFTAQIKARLDELKVENHLFESETGGHGAFHLDAQNAERAKLWTPRLLEWLTKIKMLPEKK
jgi:acetyl esterase/lipase